MDEVIEKAKAILTDAEFAEWYGSIALWFWFVYPDDI